MKKLSGLSKYFSFRVRWDNSGGYGRRGSSFGSGLSGKMFKFGVFFIGFAVLIGVLFLAFPSAFKAVNDGISGLEHLIGGT
jgi:hypothetical protein